VCTITIKHEILNVDKGGVLMLRYFVYVSLCSNWLNVQTGLGTVSLCFVPTGATAF